MSVMIAARTLFFCGFLIASSMGNTSALVQNNQA